MCGACGVGLNSAWEFSGLDGLGATPVDGHCDGAAVVLHEVEVRPLLFKKPLEPLMKDVAAAVSAVSGLGLEVGARALGAQLVDVGVRTPGGYPLDVGPAAAAAEVSLGTAAFR